MQPPARQPDAGHSSRRRLAPRPLFAISAGLVIAGVAVATIALSRSDGSRTSQVAAFVTTPTPTQFAPPTGTAIMPTTPSATPSVEPTAVEAAAAATPAAPRPPAATEAPTPIAPTIEPNAPRTDPRAGLRDKYRQPFSSDSIWNMPIGAGAAYVPARIAATSAITVDEEYWLVTDTSMPSRAFYTNATFGIGRCQTATFEFDIRIPDGFLVPDASEGNTPNAVAAILLPDGRTIEQMNPVSRCEPGGPLTAGWYADPVDIYGPGTLGAHGGSHLSSIGGSLRLGELTGDEPIRHALKVNLYGHRFLSQQQSGFRWPATAADRTALGNPGDPDSYDGDVPALRMGALLALPPSLEIGSLGLVTDAARKLAWTLQNYGAYVVDDTSWDVHAIDAEVGVADEFRSAYGFDMQATTGPWYADIMRLFSALAVVDNNGPATVGGGGATLQPIAPPIGN